MEDDQADVAEADDGALREFDSRDGRWDLERCEQRLRVLEPMAIEGVDGDLGAGRGDHRGIVADVIPVAMRRDDELQCPVTGGQLVCDPGERRRGRVDGDRLSCAWIGEDVNVGRNRADDAAEALYVMPRAWP